MQRLLAAGLLTLLAQAILTSSASATLLLSFDTVSTYSTTVGNTVNVSVYVSQVDGGTQVNANNTLVSAGIGLTYTSNAVANVPNQTAITFGSVWDGNYADFSTNGTTTLINVGLGSTTGGTDLSSRVLLARFTFTGLSVGTVNLRVADLDPSSPDYATSGGNFVDPTNTAAGTLTVTTNTAAVPEPSSLVLTALAGLVAGPVVLRGRRRRSRS